VRPFPNFASCSGFFCWPTVDYYHRGDPFTIRFAPLYARLCPCEAVALTKFSHLKSIYPRTSPRALALIWLLLTAGNVESNPGPRNWKYPCGVCSKPVKANQRSVQCEVCQYWLHTRCIGMSPEKYSELQNSDDSWCCTKCQREALPLWNISNSDSFFDTSLKTSNISAAATPAGASTSCHAVAQPPPGDSQPLSFTALYTNCRSLLPKLDHLRLLASARKPHIITVCETWLDASISNAELRIPDFSLVQHDRDRHGGGVAIYINETIPFSVILKHQSIELLLVEQKLRRKNITCGVFYRPPSTDPTSSLI